MVSDCPLHIFTLSWNPISLLSLQRLCERCNQEGEHQHGRGLKLLNRECQLFFWRSYSLSGRQACVGNSRGEAGDARGNPKGGEELAVQTSPFSPNSNLWLTWALDFYTGSEVTLNPRGDLLHPHSCQRQTLWYCEPHWTLKWPPKEKLRLGPQQKQ